MSAIAVFEAVTPDLFAQAIRPGGRPAVLRGLVTDWPAVALARRSDDELIDYLRQVDSGKPVGVYVAPPEIGGHYFYGADTRSDNFRFGPAPLGQILDRLIEQRDKPAPQGVYMQSAEIAQVMPAFTANNRLDLLPGVAPRIWIGNGSVTRAHYDLNFNLACVVAGRRKFLLFPPEQLPNLYPGPFDRTIGGVPVSMVDAANPDLELYPRFAEAQAAMLTAELEPGDALYIPYGWWHQVHALSRFNVLVNYWWDDVQPAASPYEALFHAILAIRDMPRDQQALWRTLFDYYVFDTDGEALSHLSQTDRGSLGAMTTERVAQIRKWLGQSLMRS